MALPAPASSRTGAGCPSRRALWTLTSPVVLALLGVLATAGPARAQEEFLNMLTQSAVKPTAPVRIDRVLDPVCLGAPPPPGLEGEGSDETRSDRYNVAVVLLQSAGVKDSETILREVESYWTCHGYRVAPGAQVTRSLRKLDLIDSEALAPADFSRFARMISARYLVLLTVQDARSGKVLGFGNTIAAAGRFIAVGAIFRVSHMNPWVLGALAAGVLVGGVATTATCQLGSQVFDAQSGKTVWVKTSTSTVKKVFLGLFAKKEVLAEKARQQAISRLYATVIDQLHTPVRVPAATGAAVAGPAGTPRRPRTHSTPGLRHSSN